MNVVGAIDSFQRKHPVIGFPIAVIYKYFDDQGPYLAAIITYYSFVAIFPLMLISTSILGLILQDNPALQEELLDSALAQFPVIGDELGRPDGISGSTSAILVGSIAALYGALGVGQSTQNAANIAWAVPRNSRPNPVLMRLRSFVVLGIGGAGILSIAVIQSLVDNPTLLGLEGFPVPWWLTRFLGFIITAGIFIFTFRFLSLGRANWRSVLPGATFCAVVWQGLQWVGDSYVREVIVRASSMNQTFAIVLGLVAFLFLTASMFVVGLQINVVRRRRLYPRALLTPFTDNVELAPGDIRAYTGYARAQRHKGFQTIEVSFEGERDESR